MAAEQFATGKNTTTCADHAVTNGISSAKWTRFTRIPNRLWKELE